MAKGYKVAGSISFGEYRSQCHTLALEFPKGVNLKCGPSRKKKGGAQKMLLGGAGFVSLL